MIPVKADNPPGRPPVVTLGLIGVTVLGFLLAGSGGLAYAALSMLFLWLFGPAVEVAFGRLRFLALCVAAGLAGLGLHAALESGSAAPVAAASGAVAGVIAAHLVVRPGGRILVISVVPVFVGIVGVPVIVMAGVWVAGLLAMHAAGV